MLHHEIVSRRVVNSARSWCRLLLGGLEHVIGHPWEHALRPRKMVLLHGVLGWACGIAMWFTGTVLKGRV
jgi:hypothetical protein